MPFRVGLRPIPFLALVLGGWICIRAAMLAPHLWPTARAGAVRAAGGEGQADATGGPAIVPVSLSGPAFPVSRRASFRARLRQVAARVGDVAAIPRPPFSPAPSPPTGPEEAIGRRAHSAWLPGAAQPRTARH